jgi:DNA primase
VIHVSTTIAQRLLERLEGVRRTGRGWSARCPAHEDRSASLSIAVGDDGRLLVHCFAGCAAADVVGLAGLTLGDLFESRATYATSGTRTELAEQARKANWSAALRMLDFEARIVLVAASDLRAGTPISDADLSRLGLAIERISDARSHFAPAPRFRPAII